MPLSSARGLAAEEAAHALDVTTVRAEAVLGGREDMGECSEEGVCIGGIDHDLPKSTLP